MNNLWTDKEIDLLTNNYMSMTYKEIANLLNRSETSIERKLSRLGLSKKATDDYTYWDAEKLTYLVKNYNDYSCKELGEKLGFSEKKIIKKLSDLKLKKVVIRKKVEKSEHKHINTGNICCKVCNNGFKNLKGLEIHLTKKHKEVDAEAYYLENIGSVVVCRICDEDGRFLSLTNGFRDLCKKEECIKKSYESGSIDFWINKGYNENDAKIRFKEYTTKRVESLLKGDEERLKENPNYYKEKSPTSLEFYLKKGYSENESKIMQHLVNIDHQSKMSKYIMENPEKYASKYPTKIEYYLHRGFTEEQGREMISERQKTFTLEKLIERYGEEEANKVYNSRQEKWLKSLHSNGKLKGGYSLVSQELFKKIDEYYIDNNFQYMLKNGEFVISKYCVDFIDHDTNRIIEFNGDVYHVNPNIFKFDDTPNPWNKKLLSEQIWESDRIRNELIESLGYKVFVVWELEYRKNTKQTVEKCIEFLDKNKI
jgi:very-short-patch-repair endonuclease